MMPSYPPGDGRPSAEAAFAVGLALQEAGRFREAARAYQAAVADKPDFAGAYCNLGVVLRRLGRVNEALAAYQRAVDLEPNFFEAQYCFGILLDLVGRHAAAADRFRRAIALKPDFAPAHCNLGKALQGDGDLAAAKAAYREALRRQPDHAPSLLNLAAALIETQDGAGALEVAERALTLQAGGAEALCLCAKASLLLGDEAAALDYSLRARRASPGAFETLDLLAKILVRSARRDEAVALYRDALARSPEAERAAACLADLYLEAGEASEALAVSEDFLCRHPGNTRAIAAKAAALTALGRQRDVDRWLGIERLLAARKIDAVPGFPTRSAFHAALAEHVLRHPSLKEDPAGLSTRSGRHTGELLIEPKGPIAAFEKLVVDAVVDYARTHPVSDDSPFLAAQPSRWSLTIWAVVLGASGYQEPHLHPSGWLSGVYYLAVPPGIAASDNGQRGWIEFGRPPQLPDDAVMPSLKTVAPEEGLLLLFPSYLHHRTIPTGLDAPRISLAFDVLPHDQSPR